MNPVVKEGVITKKAPKPIGPYQQAVKAGGLLFCSGQVPLDPDNGEVVGAGDVEAQTKRVMDSLGAVLEAGGSSFNKVLRCTIFLKNMDDFPKVNEIYGGFFPENPPARACVEVSRLPKDVLVEIDAIGLI